MAKKTDIQTVPESALAVPDYIPKGDTRGGEHITREDARLPRLSLAHGQSPQVTKGDPSFIMDLSVGDAFNDLTGEVYGDGPMKLIIVRADPPRWVQFDPDNRNSVLDPNVKPGDKRTEWREVDGKRVPPVATKFYDYVVMRLPDPEISTEPEIITLSFKSTGIKTATKLNGLIKMKKVPIFACVYEFTPVQMKNDLGVWYLWSVKPAGFADEDTYHAAEQAFELFKDRVVEFDNTQEPEPEPDGTETEM